MSDVGTVAEAAVMSININYKIFNIYLIHLNLVYTKHYEIILHNNF